MSVAPENGQLATHQRNEELAKLTCRCHVCDALQLHTRYVLLQKTPRVTMPQEATQNSVWEYRAIKKGQCGGRHLQPRLRTHWHRKTRPRS